MKKIQWSDAWTGSDKDKHFVLLAVGCFLLSVILTCLTLSGAFFIAWSITGISMTIGVLVSMFKEILDYYGKGTCSFQDFIVSVAGSVFGAGLFYLLFNLAV